MRLPTLLLRRNNNTHKNDFGHVLILAGSRRMLGAGALCSISAMRAGAGLVTFGVPQSLNSTALKKISNCIMTMPLTETKDQALSVAAFNQIKKDLFKYDCIAIGPGMSTGSSTQKLILKIIGTSLTPLVIDADALNAVSRNPDVLKKTTTTKILTPHPGEMSRLTGLKKTTIEKNRKDVAQKFAEKYNCILLLKGHNTVVAWPGAKSTIYINKTGNPGMSTAGSGDVLTGIIAALVGQGLSGFDAAKFGAYLHGKAGDLAAKKKTKISLIASDIIDFIPAAIKLSKQENRL